MTELCVESSLAEQAGISSDSAQSVPERTVFGHGEVSGFAEEMLRHLDAAYNLARWLMRNSADAEDVVQDAYLRAFRYAAGFRGGDARAWLLKIVRNTSYGRLQKNRAQLCSTEFDEGLHTTEGAADPETLMLQNADSQRVDQAIRALPARFREMLVLRELEGLTYKEISEVVGVPIGTVMSSLSRARAQFRQAFSEELSRRLTPARKLKSADGVYRIRFSHNTDGTVTGLSMTKK